MTKHLSENPSISIGFPSDREDSSILFRFQTESEDGVKTQGYVDANLLHYFTPKQYDRYMLPDGLALESVASETEAKRLVSEALFGKTAVRLSVLTTRELILLRRQGASVEESA